MFWRFLCSNTPEELEEVNQSLIQALEQNMQDGRPLEDQDWTLLVWQSVKTSARTMSKKKIVLLSNQSESRGINLLAST